MYRGIAGVVSETSKREDVEFEWKLNNFSLLSTEVKDRYHSPTFSVSGRSFFLELFPNGDSAHNSEGFIDLYLALRKSCPAINVKWTLAIKRADGKREELKSDIDSFSWEGDIYGVARKIPRADLVRRWLELLPLNSLTIIITLETRIPHPIEHDAANRKGGTAAGISFGGTTQQSGVFGSTPAASNSGFCFVPETPIAGIVREGHCTQLFKEIFWDIDGPINQLYGPIIRLYEKKKPSFMSPLHTFGTQECQLSLSVHRKNIIVLMNISNARYLRWSAGILRADGTEYWTGRGQALFHEDYPDLMPFGTWCGPPKNELIQQMAQALASGGVWRSSVLTFFLKISMEKVEEHATCMSMMKADKSTITEEKNEERQPLELTVLTNLSTSLKDLYVTGKDCDVTLKVGKKKFGAHKLILGARTPVLAAMFSHMTESQTSVVCIEDCHPEAFKVFLLFVYSGVAKNLTNENVNDVYYTADKYDLPPLKEVCVHHMLSNLTVDSICTTLALASRHGEEVLLQKATEYFLKNAREVYRTAAWPNFFIDNVSLANELIIRSHETVK